MLGLNMPLYNHQPMVINYSSLAEQFSNDFSDTYASQKLNFNAT